MGDKVSYPYETRGKIIGLYILVFKMLEVREEDRRLNGFVADIP
jgi:hypothetical protein